MPFPSSLKKRQQRLTSFFGCNDNSNIKSNTKRSREWSTRSSSQTKKVHRRPAGSSGYEACPLCQASFPWHTIVRHASSCDGSIPKPAAKLTAELKTTPASTNNHQTTTTTTTTLPSDEKGAAGSDSTSTISSSSPIIENTAKTVLNHMEEPIPGLFVYPNFLTEEEESIILQELDVHDSVSWKPSYFNGKSIGKRWGVHCNLRDRRVDAAQCPLPDCIHNILLPKLQNLLPMQGCFPNEANAIDYRRKQGHWLKSHVDDRSLSKEPIANLSLAGDCYMTFTNQAPHRNLAVQSKRVLLKNRCLQILTGKSRYDFSHGIANEDLLSDRRVSITMRESPLTLQPVVKKADSFFNKHAS